jgi:CRP-like cAMP-binding protein
VKVVRICSKKVIPKDTVLCSKGDESNELFILLKGQLRVMLSSATFLTYITPIGLVGEIGIFTGAKRGATVFASLDSTVIRIHKNELFALFKNDCPLSNRILMNVIADLSNKLQEDNEVIEELRMKKRTRIL